MYAEMKSNDTHVDCFNQDTWSHIGDRVLFRVRDHFHPLEVVSRWRDPQLQVSEN